jgi:hypothetical protein
MLSVVGDVPVDSETPVTDQSSKILLRVGFARGCLYAKYACVVSVSDILCNL